MASEKVRVVAFDTVDLDDGDWEGPTPHGEFLTYTSKHAAASIRVTKGGKVVLDGDYDARKTVLIDDDVKWTLFLRQPEPRLKVSPRGV
jgi:hypothetical protein